MSQSRSSSFLTISFRDRDTSQSQFLFDQSYLNLQILSFSFDVNESEEQQHLNLQIQNALVVFSFDVNESEESCRLLSISDSTNLHLLPTKEPRSHILTKKLTDSLINNTCIHLHQDVWEQQFDIVQARLLQKLVGSSGRICARKTTVQRLSKQDAHDFLTKTSLVGNNQLQILLTMDYCTGDKEREHRSVELVRYCSKGTVVSGISKLVKNFIRKLTPDDVVTIIDRD